MLGDHGMSITRQPADGDTVVFLKTINKLRWAVVALAAAKMGLSRVAWRFFVESWVATSLNLES